MPSDLVSPGLRKEMGVSWAWGSLPGVCKIAAEEQSLLSQDRFSGGWLALSCPVIGFASAALLPPQNQKDFVSSSTLYKSPRGRRKRFFLLSLRLLMRSSFLSDRVRSIFQEKLWCSSHSPFVIFIASELQ